LVLSFGLWVVLGLWAWNKPMIYERMGDGDPKLGDERQVIAGWRHDRRLMTIKGSVQWWVVVLVLVRAKLGTALLAPCPCGIISSMLLGTSCSVTAETGVAPPERDDLAMRAGPMHC
jgi:hypothetical protein